MARQLLLLLLLLSCIFSALAEVKWARGVEHVYSYNSTIRFGAEAVLDSVRLVHADKTRLRFLAHLTVRRLGEEEEARGD